MKILQINSAKNFGGGERHLLDLISGLTEAGHEVFLASRRKNNWADKLKNFTGLKTFTLPLHNALDLSSAWQMAKIIRQNNIEIIHAHVARDYPLAVMAAALAGNEAQVILTRHVLFPLKTIHKLLLKKVAAIIAVSKAVENQLTEQEIFTKEKIKLVLNSVKFDQSIDVTEKKCREFRCRYQIKSDELLVTTVGELKDLKGQDDFLKAAAVIAKDCPQARFAVVGKDNSKSKSFKKYLKSMAEELNLTGKVLWIDHCEDIDSLMASTDVFVSSSHVESFGLAILEAMTAGCAVVATATDGAKEILQNGKIGRLVAMQSPAEIASAVGGFLASEKFRKKSGEVGQRAAKSNFSFAKMINLTERVYFHCLAEKRMESFATTGNISILSETHLTQS